jgi:hypothetical protein
MQLVSCPRNDAAFLLGEVNRSKQSGDCFRFLKQSKAKCKKPVAVLALREGSVFMQLVSCPRNTN